MSNRIEQYKIGNAPVMKEQTENNLPECWALAKLGYLCTHPQYGWTTSANKNGTGLKLLHTSDISSGAVNWSKVPACDKKPR